MSSPPVIQYEPQLQSGLERGLGVVQATALNISNMVGVGPFITIPIFLAAMGGPQAMIAWVAAAILVLCDGLVWSELGAALPGSGGTYHFLRQVFGIYRFGRVMPFLFIWQFLISGTLELASGYIGAMDYISYAVPQLAPTLARWHVPGGMGVVAAGMCLVITLMLCGRIRLVGWMAVVFCAGTLVTIFIVIGAGLMHFNRSLLRMPPGAFHMNWTWVLGLGAAMRIAVYDYLGYYNICHLGDEVKRPERTIPRAIIWSVILIAALYLTMNVCIIGVVPWREAMDSQNIAATFMEKLYGRPIAVAFTALIIWTAAACCFSMTLGYSRIPYAAAREGDFFRVFGLLHSRGRFPWVSLMTVSGLTAVFCFFPLQTVIDAAVTVRILVQFVGQIVALHLLRVARPDVPLPFRMWLYPVPSLIALAGWIFMWSTSGLWLICDGIGVIVAGVLVFIVWRRFFPEPSGPMDVPIAIR
jgi:amino acid transporter